MALHFDPIRVTQELEAEGFEHRQAVGLVNVIRNHILAPVSEGRDEDADSAVAAITQTGQALRVEIGASEIRLNARIDAVETRLNARIDGVDAKIDAVEARLGARIDGVDAKIDGVQADVAEVRQEVRDLRHEMQILARDTVEKAGARADAAASRTNMWIGLATVFLGLMIGASAILPAVIALFR